MTGGMAYFAPPPPTLEPALLLHSILPSRAFCRLWTSHLLVDIFGNTGMQEYLQV